MYRNVGIFKNILLRMRDNISQFKLIFATQFDLRWRFAVPSSRMHYSINTVCKKLVAMWAHKL